MGKLFDRVKANYTNIELKPEWILPLEGEEIEVKLESICSPLGDYGIVIYLKNYGGLTVAEQHEYDNFAETIELKKLQKEYYEWLLQIAKKEQIPSKLIAESVRLCGVNRQVIELYSADDNKSEVLKEEYDNVSVYFEKIAQYTPEAHKKEERITELSTIVRNKIVQIGLNNRVYVTIDDDDHKTQHQSEVVWNLEELDILHDDLIQIIHDKMFGADPVAEILKPKSKGSQRNGSANKHQKKALASAVK